MAKKMTPKARDDERRRKSYTEIKISRLASLNFLQSIAAPKEDQFQVQVDLQRAEIAKKDGDDTISVYLEVREGRVKFVTSNWKVNGKDLVISGKYAIPIASILKIGVQI